MNVVQRIYPYVLATLNIAVGWLSYVLLTPDFAVPFLAIGLLVFIAVIGQTVAGFRSVLRDAVNHPEGAGVWKDFAISEAQFDEGDSISSDESRARYGFDDE